MRLRLKKDLFNFKKGEGIEAELMRISKRDLIGVCEVDGAYYGEFTYLEFAKTFGYNFFWGRNIFSRDDIKATFPEMPDSFFVGVRSGSPIVNKITERNN